MHEQILHAVRECANGPCSALQRSLHPYRAPEAPERAQHQLLVMLKPEALDVRAGVDVGGVLQLLFRQSATNTGVYGFTGSLMMKSLPLSTPSL